MKSMSPKPYPPFSLSTLVLDTGSRGLLVGWTVIISYKYTTVLFPSRIYKRISARAYLVLEAAERAMYDSDVDETQNIIAMSKFFSFASKSWCIID